jgi:hypothetical protein
MPELSPQAQEVFWAFNRAASGKPEEWHYLPAIVAAIREIAAKYSYEVHGDGWYELVVDASDLYALADELEAFAQ